MQVTIEEVRNRVYQTRIDTITRRLNNGAYGDEHSSDRIDINILLEIANHYLKEDRLNSERMSMVEQEWNTGVDWDYVPGEDEPYTFEDVRSGPDVELSSLDDEAFRVYRYPCGATYQIDNPVALHISESGSHYVIDGGGLVHYMKPNFNTFTWVPAEDAEYHLAW